MNKNVGFALLALLAIGTVAFVVLGMSGGSSSKASGEGAAADKAASADEQGGKKEAPLVRKDELPEAAQGADAGNLVLPGQLPALKGVQEAAGQATPALPHGQLTLEGDVQEAEAEAAIKAMFPAIRDCYVELRQRAPQARGRMLMTFKVRAAEANQGATGELFLKETQFTDPKYLTCVRSAIDAARFPVSRNVQGSVTVPLFLSPQDAGEPATP